MKNLLQLSEDEFQLWLKSQLEKREFMCGYRFEKGEIERQIYEILFMEQNMTMEEIEWYFIPFGQAGYLSAREKFELMMFVLEKDYGDASLILTNEMGKENMVTSERVEEAYLEWVQDDRMILSEEEKKEFFVRTLADKFGLGFVEVLQRLAQDGFLVGEMCPPLYEGETIESRIAICKDGEIIRLPFLYIGEREELIRIIKCVISRENKGELTVMEPIWECVREDGTCITAIRPPGGADWGIRVLYGAARKERKEWQQ